MKKTILLATDFSPAAANATDYAAEMAEAVHADLYLLHVCQAPVSFGDLPMLITMKEIWEAAEKALQEIKTKLSRRYNGKLTIETEICSGSVFHSLKEVSARIKPYAVVMGSQGTSASERFLFGSRTIHAVQHLEWPLVTVPKGASFSAIKRIGLACDLGKGNEMISPDEIRTLVNDFNAELHILHVDKNNFFAAGSVFEQSLLLDMLKDLDPQYHFIEQEDIDEGILNFAEKIGLDLLLVIPGRRNLIESLLHKSHTKQFVLHCHVPVMALHTSHAW